MTRGRRTKGRAVRTFFGEFCRSVSYQHVAARTREAFLHYSQFSLTTTSSRAMVH